MVVCTGTANAKKISCRGGTRYKAKIRAIDYIHLEAV